MLNDYVFRSGQMVGWSLALTVGTAVARLGDPLLRDVAPLPQGLRADARWPWASPELVQLERRGDVAVVRIDHRP
jgi:hypothetical protein